MIELYIMRNIFATRPKILR